MSSGGYALIGQLVDDDDGGRYQRAGNPLRPRFRMFRSRKPQYQERREVASSKRLGKVRCRVMN